MAMGSSSDHDDDEEDHREDDSGDDDDFSDYENNDDRPGSQARPERRRRRRRHRQELTQEDEEDGDREDDRGRPRSRTEVTAREFAAYRLMERHTDGHSNHIFRYGRLFMEYLVDFYCKIEASHLRYIRVHQGDLRAHLYRGVADAVARGDDTAAVGNG